MSDGQFAKIIDEVTKKLIDDGRLIEAGWRSLRIVAIPQNASDTQIREMRKAFFAGAQHLYASIMGFLEEGKEPTDTDMRRMENLDRELKRFVKELKEEMFS